MIWYEGRNTAITGWKKRKILTAVSIIHLQPILKEKREEAPDRNFYRLRKWIMGRVTWIKTDLFFFFVVTFFSVRSRSRSRKEGGRGTKEEAQRERERKKRRVRKRRRKVEEERKEGSGVASTLDWNLKIPGSIPGSTLKEIIHPKTTSYFGIIGDRFDLKLIPEFNGSIPVLDWVEKVELNCLLSGVKSIEHVIPLCLSGGAFAVYQQLGVE